MFLNLVFSSNFWVNPCCKIELIQQISTRSYFIELQTLLMRQGKKFSIILNRFFSTWSVQVKANWPQWWWQVQWRIFWYGSLMKPCIVTCKSCQQKLWCKNLCRCCGVWTIKKQLISPVYQTPIWRSCLRLLLTAWSCSKSRRWGNGLTEPNLLSTMFAFNINDMTSDNRLNSQ